MDEPLGNGVRKRSPGTGVSIDFGTPRRRDLRTSRRGRGSRPSLAPLARAAMSEVPALLGHPGRVWGALTAIR